MKPLLVLVIPLILVLYFFVFDFVHHREPHRDTRYLKHTIRNERTIAYESSIGASRSGRCLFQTYHTKSKIPEEVFSNIREYAPEYNHIVLDDSEISEFLQAHFSPSVYYTFLNLRSGAHKADLARYCLLYIYGGVYMDIKTELIGPLSELFRDPDTLYTVLSYQKRQIYQGIIASPPKNPFFLSLIDYIVATQNPWYYLGFCADFYIQIEKDLGAAVRQGGQKGTQPYYLFQEKCSTTSNLCGDGLDRYGFCCYVWDGDRPVIKTRRASYPWK